MMLESSLAYSSGKIQQNILNLTPTTVYKAAKQSQMYNYLITIQNNHEISDFCRFRHSLQNLNKLEWYLTE